ncbi:portal protein [Methylobacterium sp. Leaf123]|nr:portal protein [Methylobacterium sp. Leaf123]
MDFLRVGSGTETATGMHIDVERALKNPSMFRAVSLISYAIGMLPLQLIEEETKRKASNHPLYRLLHREPNDFQTAFDFRVQMQMRALVRGNAFALIVRSRDLRAGGERITKLIPLDPTRMTVKLNEANWTVEYRYQPPQGGARTYGARDIFHLRGLTMDGLNGLSLVRQAAEAIGLALAAERAAARLFKHGVMAGGGLKHPGKLSAPAYERLAASIAEKEGADNAGKTLIFEEGLEWMTMAVSARDAQMTELRKLQVEEIARVTGVPRPLLMVDETSWGSGIEALGRFFVQYALGPWFEAWQQAGERSLLTTAEKDTLTIKFNPGALLRGSTKDQADFYAKALGSGGAPGWMDQNEIRDLADLPARTGHDTISMGTAKAAGAAPNAEESENGNGGQ